MHQYIIFSVETTYLFIKIKMSFLECPHCYSRFDKCYRKPRLLCCGHTFCTTCLNSLIKNTSKCPACKAPIEEKNINYYAVNFYVLQFISTNGSRLNNQLACKTDEKQISVDKVPSCKEHNKECLKYWCESCEDWLCEIFARNHEHDVITKSEFYAKLISIDAKSEYQGTMLSLDHFFDIVCLDKNPLVLSVHNTEKEIRGQKKLLHFRDSLELYIIQHQKQIKQLQKDMSESNEEIQCAYQASDICKVYKKKKKNEENLQRIMCQSDKIRELKVKVSFWHSIIFSSFRKLIKIF